MRRAITSSIDEILVLFSEYELLMHSKKFRILNLFEEARRNGIKVRIIVYCENNKIKNGLKSCLMKTFLKSLFSSYRNR